MRYSPVKVKIIKRGITMRDFARRYGFEESLVRKVLAGTRFNADVQDAISEFLGEPGSAIFGADWHEYRKRRAS